MTQEQKKRKKQEEEDRRETIYPPYTGPLSPFSAGYGDGCGHDHGGHSHGDSGGCGGSGD